MFDESDESFPTIETSFTAEPLPPNTTCTRGSGLRC